MTPDTTIRRPLTATELENILTAMSTAGDHAHLLYATVATLLDVLLADDGRSMATLAPGEKIDPRRWAIPATQWEAITEIALRYAARWGSGPQLMLDLVHRLPATYDDPAVPVPALDIPDLRPGQLTIEVSRDAVDVIAACTAHVHALAIQYGPGSDIYRTAADSWLKAVTGLLSMGFGAATRIRRDDPLSLYVTTGSGHVYGLLWHPATRWCTAGDGCQAIIRDDGTARPAGSTGVVADHEHVPAFPPAAPVPGQWYAHS